MRNIFEKFGREDQNPGGWYPPPLGRPKVDFYLGHLRVNFKIALQGSLMPSKSSGNLPQNEVLSSYSVWFILYYIIVLHDEILYLFSDQLSITQTGPISGFSVYLNPQLQDGIPYFLDDDDTSSGFKVSYSVEVFFYFINSIIHNNNGNRSQMSIKISYAKVVVVVVKSICKAPH